MDRQELIERLQQLQVELDRTDPQDNERRELLRRLKKELQAALERTEGAPAEHYRPLLDQLQLALTEFEASHSELTLAITQAINALANLGV